MNQDFTKFSQNLSPEVYDSLKRALELGKWPDGKVLTKEQRETCMQAIISYESAHVAEEERAGYLGQTCKSKKSVSENSGSGGVGYFNGDQKKH